MTVLGALVAFPLKIEWTQIQGPPAAEPFPAPVCTTRDGHLKPPMPDPVTTLLDALRCEGWSVMAQHSAGHVPHATHGRPGAGPVEHWALRAYKGERGALAMRKGAAWEFFYVWSKDGFGRCTTVGHFRDVLRFGPWLSPAVSGPEDCSWLVKWQGPMPPVSG